MEILFWLLFSAGVGYFAHTKGRNPVGWGALALLISPIMAVIILAVVKDLNIEKKIDQIDNKTDNLKMEMNYNQKFNDHRAEHMSGQIKSLDSFLQGQNRINSTDQKYQLDRKIKCNSCGESVSYNSKFCPKCGREIDKEKICVTCNQKYPIDSKFCPHCGREIDKEKICVTCNQKYPIDSKFCPHCGAKAETNQTCSNCGEKYEMGTKFCASCGTSLVSV